MLQCVQKLKTSICCYVASKSGHRHRNKIILYNTRNICKKTGRDAERKRREIWAYKSQNKEARKGHGNATNRIADVKDNSWNWRPIREHTSHQMTCSQRAKYLPLLHTLIPLPLSATGRSRILAGRKKVGRDHSKTLGSLHDKMSNLIKLHWKLRNTKYNQLMKMETIFPKYKTANEGNSE